MFRRLIDRLSFVQSTILLTLFLIVVSALITGAAVFIFEAEEFLWPAVAVAVLLTGMFALIRTHAFLRYVKQLKVVEDKYKQKNSELEKEVARRAEAELKLTQQRDYLNSIIDSLANPFYVINADDYSIELANAAARSLGVSTISTCYALTHRLSEPCGGAEHPCPLSLVRQSKGPAVVEHIHFDKDGNPVQMEVHAYPIFDGDGNLSHMIEYSIDISERKRAEKTARKHIEILEEKNAELDAFSHTVAHDLKNPMGAITGFAELLLQNDPKIPEKKQHACLQNILQSGKKMETIINELLLLANVSGMSKVELSPVTMGKMMITVQKRLENLIREYRAELIVPSNDAWPPALGYAPWIEEVWANYISNAFKYGGRPPCVEVGGTVLPDARVKYWVRDNGDGLTPEEQARLFTPFQRLHKSGIKGHGLGLSIVRRIVEKLGGEIGVESDGEPGKGSLFYFILPGVRERDEQEKLMALTADRLLPVPIPDSVTQVFV